MDENYEHDVDSIKEKLDQAPEFIRGIDWRLLKEQKQYLYDVIDNGEQSLHEDVLCLGLIGLIDSLQDYVCDEIGMPDYMIFGEEILGENEFNEQDN